MLARHLIATHNKSVPHYPVGVIYDIYVFKTTNGVKELLGVYIGSTAQMLKKVIGNPQKAAKMMKVRQSKRSSDASSDKTSVDGGALMYREIDPDDTESYTVECWAYSVNGDEKQKLSALIAARVKEALTSQSLFGWSMVRNGTDYTFGMAGSETAYACLLLKYGVQLNLNDRFSIEERVRECGIPFVLGLTGILYLPRESNLTVDLLEARRILETFGGKSLHHINAGRIGGPSNILIQGVQLPFDADHDAVRDFLYESGVTGWEISVDGLVTLPLSARQANFDLSAAHAAISGFGGKSLHHINAGRIGGPTIGLAHV
jgi:hypothetical protein